MTLKESALSCCGGGDGGGIDTGIDTDTDIATTVNSEPNSAEIQEQVREYYGKTLQGSGDLKTSSCCCGADAQPAEVRAVLPLIADEISRRFYGCGSPLPPLLEGATVLDLGCGTGQDSYVAAKLVGENGRVIGVDMTPEQLEVAQKYQVEQAQRFGFSKPNTSFIQAYIEDLAGAGIQDNSIDVVISNCVINLSPDKEQVFKEIYRVLKPGGELYFSDVFADRRIPADAQTDPIIRGECLGGAMYTEDFRRLLQGVGWPDFRVVAEQTITVDDPGIAQILAGIEFVSRTIRAIKTDLLEDRCEQYGQIIEYRGTIPYYEDAFKLDGSHILAHGVPTAVCGNSAAMVQESRYQPHFIIKGNRDIHYGLFLNCGDNPEPGLSTGCC